jgi:hypothetical protein
VREDSVDGMLILTVDGFIFKEDLLVGAACLRMIAGDFTPRSKSCSVFAMRCHIKQLFGSENCGATCAHSRNECGTLAGGELRNSLLRPRL